MERYCEKMNLWEEENVQNGRIKTRKCNEKQLLGDCTSGNVINKSM